MFFYTFMPKLFSMSPDEAKAWLLYFVILLRLLLKKSTQGHFHC